MREWRSKHNWILIRVACLVLLIGSCVLVTWWANAQLSESLRESTTPRPPPIGTPSAKSWTIGAPVSHVRFSPDGHAVALLRSDGTIEMRSVPDGRLLGSITASPRAATAPYYGDLAFSSDGTSLATAGGQYEQLTAIVTPDTPAWQVQADVRLWTVSRDGLYSLKPARTLTSTTLFEPNSSQERPPPVPSSLAFSPDGQVLAVGNQAGYLMLWDTGTGQLVQTLPSEPRHMTTFPGDNFDIVSVAWSPDGTSVAAGDGNEVVRQWAFPTGKLLYEDSHPSYHDRGSTYIQAYAFSRDLTMEATSSVESEAYLWKFGRTELLHTLGAMDPYHGPNEATVGSDLVSLVFSPDGTLLASGGAMARCSGDSACGDNDPSVRIWRVSDGAHLALYSGHSDRVNTLDWGSDGRTLISGSEDGTVRLWDVSKLR